MKLLNLIKSKFIYRAPNKTKLLILDKPGSVLISKVLKKKTDTLEVRYEKINLYIVFKMILNFDKLSMQSYIFRYIEKVNPKLIISHIDNNNFFFKLKSLFPDINFIFIQNGLSLKSYTQKKIKNLGLNADHFFVYSKAYAQSYKRILRSKFYAIGSFKNNFKKKIYKNKKNCLVFISQFSIKKQNGKHHYKYRDFSFSHDDFFRSELFLIPILYDFCLKKNIKLIIAGRNMQKEKYIEEKKFYEKIILNNFNKKKLSNFIFKRIKSDFSSYDIIDSSKLVVFVDSALGYQSLSRGNISFACSIRSKFVKNKTLDFGWPLKMQKEGPFWLSYYNKKKINYKLNYLFGLSRSDWNKKYNKYKDDLLSHDENNKIFKTCVNKLLKSSRY